MFRVHEVISSDVLMKKGKEGVYHRDARDEKF